MLKVTKNTLVYVASAPVDFRKGIDSLAQLCRESFGQDPMGGSIFLFCNRRRTSVKILVYDGQGFWLCMKRLSLGRWNFWPRPPDGEGSGLLVGSRELSYLLSNGQEVTK